MKPVSMAIVVALFVFAVIMLAACSDSSTDLSDLSEIASQDRSSGAASFNLSSDQSEQNKNIQKTSMTWDEREIKREEGE